MAQKSIIPKILFFVLLLIGLFIVQQLFFTSSQRSSNFDQNSETKSVLFQNAKENGLLANEGFSRCLRFVHGWLKHADPATGLLPRNLTKDRDIWNAKDCAADNYPFLVLTTALLDRPLFNGRMRQILDTEMRLTSRLGRLPDTYSFSKKGFLYNTPDIGRIMFGSSEYVKDGLLPLTEWLGTSPWSKRMIGILDDMWKQAPLETPFGKIVSDNVEVNGEMLQTLSRVYWMTGDRKYLDWAIRLGDYYLLGNHHPTRDLKRLKLRDHGCEIISGLCELYASLNFARPEKKSVYRQPLYAMLDQILEVGRNADGLFYNEINPRTGEILNHGIADTWGYTFNGYYTIYLIDKTDRYRQATLKAMNHLIPNYVNFDWEHGSADGYADAIESALNLYNREPVPIAGEWIDSQIRVMWKMQQPDGIIEGWYGDGNFARTTIMYCLWKTQGITIDPWRKDVIFGAVVNGGKIYLSISAEKNWNGRIIFDQPRNRSNMHLPLDWPRINQFPEWFTVQPQEKYTIREKNSGTEIKHSGEVLIQGVPSRLTGSQEKKFIIDQNTEPVF